jgi:hypothetical protein
MIQTHALKTEKRTCHVTIDEQAEPMRHATHQGLLWGGRRAALASVARDGETPPPGVKGFLSHSRGTKVKHRSTMPTLSVKNP